MKIKLLGFIEYSDHKPANTDKWQDFDEGGTYWDLYFKGEEKLFVVTVSSTYGSCGSGYTSASWGEIDRIKEISHIKDNYTPTIKDVYIELLENNILNTKFQTPESSWDAQIEQLLSTDEDWIAESTGDGGCQYYSSGEAKINKSLFQH